MDTLNKFFRHHKNLFLFPLLIIGFGVLIFGVVYMNKQSTKSQDINSKAAAPIGLRPIGFQNGMPSSLLTTTIGCKGGIINPKNPNSLTNIQMLCLASPDDSMYSRCEFRYQKNGGPYVTIPNDSPFYAKIITLPVGSYVVQARACRDTACDSWVNGSATNGLLCSESFKVTNPPPSPTPTPKPTHVTIGCKGAIVQPKNPQAGLTTQFLCLASPDDALYDRCEFRYQTSNGSYVAVANQSPFYSEYLYLPLGSYTAQARACNSTGCDAWKTGSTSNSAALCSQQFTVVKMIATPTLAAP